VNMIHDDTDFGYGNLTNTTTNGHHKEEAKEAVENGITLEQYAEAKRLPLEFLSSLNLKDTSRDFAPAIRIPYPDELGKERYHRYRLALKAEPRFHSPPKHVAPEPVPYGLQVLGEARKAGYILLVEGESDAQVLWFNDIPALGIPGVQSWRKYSEKWASYLEDIPLVLVPVESDSGGEKFWGLLRSAKALRGRIHKLPLVSGRVKDVGDLWKHAFDNGETERFKSTIEHMVWLTSSTSPYLGKVEGGHVEKLASFGAVRLVDVGDPGPDDYLVRNIVMHSQPTYFYAKEGACKSLITMALAVAP
jgi:hypothetical protein